MIQLISFLKQIFNISKMKIDMPHYSFPGLYKCTLLLTFNHTFFQKKELLNT